MVRVQSFRHFYLKHELRLCRRAINHCNFPFIISRIENQFLKPCYIMYKSLLLILILGLVSENLGQSGGGICSWYGAEGEIPPGWPTACGNGFDRFAMAAAHPNLPCGTRIRVTNRSNGKSVIVEINDRGPFVPGRVVDLTFGAFGLVENHDKGLMECDYDVVRPNSID
ncbi:unnamed protein product [Allacma fusca]|uniref:RlpA-like protein double-psi beta-barrel domain-containing protein n=1 Tax=Allacma fusca TaxID=39272 RepID=A0A8J2PWV2_9HEXA|nr:unnamed protein product [Allacma fusca]